MNSAGPRRTRVQPERSGPIRNPLIPPPNVNGAASYGAQQAGPRPESPAHGTLRDLLECGVRTAYTVIDDYMKRGYEAARSNRNHGDNRGHMHNDRRNYGSGTNPWGPMAAPMQQWASVMCAWANAWTTMMPGGFAQEMWGPWWPGGGMPRAASAPVSVQVTSQRPVEVTTVLSPGDEFLKLGIEPLEGSAGKPPLKGVSITSGHGSVRVHVEVTAQQPAGIYCGDIKADGRTAGTLTVVISEAPGKPA